MQYMFLVKKDNMATDLYILDKNGTLTNETSMSLVSKNKTIEETRYLFAFYMRATILEEIEILE
jgi:hypothetical protein